MVQPEGEGVDVQALREHIHDRLQCKDIDMSPKASERRHPKRGAQHAVVVHGPLRNVVQRKGVALGAPPALQGGVDRHQHRSGMAVLIDLPRAQESWGALAPRPCPMALAPDVGLPSEQLTTWRGCGGDLYGHG